MEVTYRLATMDNGNLRKVKSGHYQMTVILDDGEGGVMEISGFRITPSFTSILLPSFPTGKGGLFPIVTLSPQWQIKILEEVKAEYYID